jgi:hypothetical protein
MKRIKFRQLAACNSVSDRFLSFKIRLHDLHIRRREINKFKASLQCLPATPPNQGEHLRLPEYHAPLPHSLP